MPRLACAIAALPESKRTAEAVELKLAATCGRLWFPGGLTAATQQAGAEPQVTGRARPYDSSTLRRELKAMAAAGATALVERAVEQQVERAVGTAEHSALAHTDMFDQPYYTKALTHAGPIGALNNKLLAAVYFGVTTVRPDGGPVLVYHLSWDKPATPLRLAVMDLHASPSRHAWLTEHLRRHTWDRGGNGLPLLQYAHSQQIPYLTMANGWVYLSSQRASFAQTLDRQPVFVRRDVRMGHALTAPLDEGPRVVIFPAHPEQGADGVRGLRYLTDGALVGDEVLRMDKVYKARWPEMENVLKALVSVGFGLNRDRRLVLATSRGTDGKIERLEAKNDALGAEVAALSHEAPSRAVFAKIERRVRRQETLRDQVEALHAEPLTKKVRPATGLEMMCKYIQLLLFNALALLLARSPLAAVRMLTPTKVRELLWGRHAFIDVVLGKMTLWVDPVVEARPRRMQEELLRLFNESHLRLRGAKIRLRLAQPREIDTS